MSQNLIKSDVDLCNSMVDQLNNYQDMPDIINIKQELCASEIEFPQQEVDSDGNEDSKLSTVNHSDGIKCKQELEPDTLIMTEEIYIKTEKGQESLELLIKSETGKPENNEPLIKYELEQDSLDLDELSCENNIDIKYELPEGEGNASVNSTNTDSKVDDRDKIIANLRKKIEFLEKKQEFIGKLFSTEQLKKLEGIKCRLRWSVEDMSKAMVIYSAGPRSYRKLLKKGYPFPAVSSLRAWIKKIKIAPGILKNVFNIMKFSEMSAVDKVCVISFDEMKVKRTYAYDNINDETMRPYDYVQVVMLRGLFKSWKQPVFYNFDCKMTKEKLFGIIQSAESSGFQIVAMVSDLSGANRALYNELHIDHISTFFNNPANNEKIFVLADVPHLIKLIRNNFVDYGFIINNQEINKSIVEEVLDLSSSSNLTITKDNLNDKGATRQKVKWAAKLFSRTISKAIIRCGTLGYLKQENWIECAHFFQQVNDWFDVMNVPMSDSINKSITYGLALEFQNGIIDAMTRTVESLRVKGKTYLFPFQKGIIMTNNSIKLLLEDVRRRFSTKYLVTYRLNQEVLENLFGVIRATGGHDQPDPLQFKYGLRSYILGRNKGSYSSLGNIEDDELSIAINEVNLCAPVFSSVGVDEDVDIPLNDLESELCDIEYDGLEQLAGYICHKIKQNDASRLKTQDYSWTSHLSEGGLCKPSAEFVSQMQALEKVFQSINSNTLLITKCYLKKVLHASSSITCPEETKILFFRSRMYFRIKALNQDLHNLSKSRKRKITAIIT